MRERRAFTLSLADTNSLRATLAASPPGSTAVWPPKVRAELERLGRAYGFDPLAITELRMANSGAVIYAAEARKPEECDFCGHSIAEHRLRTKAALCGAPGCECKGLRT